MARTFEELNESDLREILRLALIELNRFLNVNHNI